MVKPGLCIIWTEALTRCSWVPWNLTTRSTGHHFLNSLIQLCRVDLGTMTMWGPEMPLNSCRYPSREIVCRVLPKPCRSECCKRLAIVTSGTSCNNLVGIPSGQSVRQQTVLQTYTLRQQRPAWAWTQAPGMMKNDSAANSTATPSNAAQVHAASMTAPPRTVLVECKMHVQPQCTSNPNPIPTISSAKMPLIPLSYRWMSQLRPSIWYFRI